MTTQISNIKYKNKIIDRGLIISTRKCRWLLKKNYDPCWAKHYKRFISELSPHKKHFDIYIPLSELKCFMPIRIFNRDLKEIFIMDLTENTITYTEKILKKSVINKENNYGEEREDLPI